MEANKPCPYCGHEAHAVTCRTCPCPEKAAQPVREQGKAHDRLKDEALERIASHWATGDRPVAISIRGAVQDTAKYVLSAFKPVGELCQGPCMSCACPGRCVEGANHRGACLCLRHSAPVVSLRAGMGLLACPFCGGEGLPQKELREGYENCKGDEDAYAYSIRCRSCAATGGWSKSSPSGAERWWNMRASAPPPSTGEPAGCSCGTPSTVHDVACPSAAAPRKTPGELAEQFVRMVGRSVAAGTSRSMLVADMALHITADRGGR